MRLASLKFGFAWNDAGVIHIGITEVMSANWHNRWQFSSWKLEVIKFKWLLTTDHWSAIKHLLLNVTVCLWMLLPTLVDANGVGCIVCLRIELSDRNFLHKNELLMNSKFYHQFELRVYHLLSIRIISWLLFYLISRHLLRNATLLLSSPAFHLQKHKPERSQKDESLKHCLANTAASFDLLSNLASLRISKNFQLPFHLRCPDWTPIIGLQCLIRSMRISHEICWGSDRTSSSSLHWKAQLPQKST